ncbi:MAG: Uma2 family endonuclease [Candidatus Kapabacteria bacterium]|jgi:Uma2 family endonuclease|nr:Uma2 family endonuclease [Candidatus Kapabacteria bacterium]
METVISSGTASIIPTIYYPDSDGLPMANNTEHLERIITTKHGLEYIFADRDDVFVAADLFWYPVEGKPKIVVAPDVMVALGRPKGERKSYKQWEEGGIAPQVVFEFLSDANSPSEMTRKAVFFSNYGVQEYYIYDIEHKQLSGFIRFQSEDEMLEEIPDMTDWKSPRLGIFFTMEKGELQLLRPDRTPFLSYDEYTNIETLLAQKQREAEQEKSRAEQEKSRAEQEKSRAELAESRAKLLEAKLRELGINTEDVEQD